MTIQIDVAQLGPALVEDLSQNGGEIMLTRYDLLAEYCTYEYRWTGFRR